MLYCAHESTRNRAITFCGTPPPQRPYFIALHLLICVTCGTFAGYSERVSLSFIATLRSTDQRVLGVQAEYRNNVNTLH